MVLQLVTQADLFDNSNGNFWPHRVHAAQTAIYQDRGNPTVIALFHVSNQTLSA